MMTIAGRDQPELFASWWYGERLLPLASACIRSFLAKGHPFVLHTYQPLAGVPARAETRSAHPLLAKGDVFIAHGGLETAADLFAYRYLHAVGGWIVDADVVRGAGPIPACEIAFAEERPGIINNAVLKFPRAHPAIAALLEHLATVDPVSSPWGSTGPLALTRVLGSMAALAPRRLPTSAVYPIHWREAPMMLFPQFTAELSTRTSASAFIHLWGATLREIGFDLATERPPAGSFLAGVYERHLDEEIARTLRPVDERALRRSVGDYLARTWGERYLL